MSFVLLAISTLFSSLTRDTQNYSKSNLLFYFNSRVNCDIKNLMASYRLKILAGGISLIFDIQLAIAGCQYAMNPADGTT